MPLHIPVSFGMDIDGGEMPIDGVTMEGARFRIEFTTYDDGQTFEIDDLAAYGWDQERRGYHDVARVKPHWMHSSWVSEWAREDAAPSNPLPSVIRAKFEAYRASDAYREDLIASAADAEREYVRAA